MLEQRGIRYQELHHPEAFTAQQVAQAEHVSGHHVAKVVVIMADGRPYELVLPASRRVMLDRVREALGANDVRLASEAEMERLFADCEVGAIPPLPAGGQVSMIMDETMRVPGDIVFQSGTHTDAVRMQFEDWFRMANPRLASFSELARTIH